MVIPNNIRNSKSKPYILACAVFIIMILSGYWLKSQMGFSFSEKYSLSKYIPFKYLVPNNVIDDPPPGILLNDSFDSFSLFGNWTDLKMREQGSVTKGYDKKGLNNSQCLLIKSSSKKSWSCAHKKKIRVKEGDIFSFKVSAKLQGEKLSAYAGVVALDDNKQVISWNYIAEKIDFAREWITIEKTFTIPEGITYIRFRLTGIGVGEVRFDDVSFLKKQD